MQWTSLVVIAGAFVNLATELANLATAVVSRREATSRRRGPTVPDEEGEDAT
jgi:hypothetical protein